MPGMDPKALGWLLILTGLFILGLAGIVSLHAKHCPQWPESHCIER